MEIQSPAYHSDTQQLFNTLQHAYDKKKSVYVYSTKTDRQFNVKVIPSWNIPLKIWSKITNRQAKKKLRAYLLSILSDKNEGKEIKRSALNWITSNKIPCFSKSERAQLQKNYSFLNRYITVLEDNIVSNSLQKKLFPNNQKHENNYYFINDEKEYNRVINYYKKESMLPGEVEIIQSPHDFQCNELLQTRYCDEEGLLHLLPGRLEIEEPLTLILDLTKMNKDEILSLKSLFDQPPYFHGRKLSSHVTIACLINDKVKPLISNTIWHSIDHSMVYHAVPLPSDTTDTDVDTGLDTGVTDVGTDPHNNDNDFQDALTDAFEVISLKDYHSDITTALFGGIQKTSRGEIYYKTSILERIHPDKKYILTDLPSDNQTFLTQLKETIKNQGFWSNGSWVPWPKNISCHTTNSHQRAIEAIAHIPLFQPTKKQETIFLNEANFDLCMQTNYINESGQLMISTPFEKFVPKKNTKGQDQQKIPVNLHVSSRLTLDQWYSLLTMIPQNKTHDIQLTIDSTVDIPKIYSEALKKFQVTKNINTPIKNIYEAEIDDNTKESFFDYWITPDTSIETLLGVEHLIDKSQGVYDIQLSSLMTALKNGHNIRLHGLESNPYIARCLESLLAPEPHVFIAGRKFDVIVDHLQCVTLDDKPLPGLWSQCKTQTESLKNTKNPKAWIKQQNLDKIISEQELTALNNLHQNLLSINSLIKKTATSPMFAITPNFIKKIFFTLERHRINDKSSVLSFYHWRKALSDTIAKEYKHNPQIYSYIKAQINKNFPDDMTTDNVKVNVDALETWFQKHGPLLTKEDIKNNYWQLIRHCSSSTTFSIPENFHDITDENIQDLYSILKDSLPKTFKLDIPLAPPKKSINIEKIRGFYYKQTFNALMLAEKIKNSVEPLHQQAHQLAKDLDKLPLPLKKKDVSRCLQGYFPSDLLEHQYSDLANALMKQQASQIKKIRRIKKMTDIFQDHPLLSIIGEPGTGKKSLAYSTAQQYFPNKTPCLLTLSDQTTYDDLFGFIEKSTLKKNDIVRKYGQSTWTMLCQLTNHPSASPTLSMSFDKDIKKALQASLSSKRYTQFMQELHRMPTSLHDSFLVEWAKNPQPPVLILQNANLTKGSILNPFIGVTRYPPSLSIHGHTIPLTENHRIIMTGHPESYDGRSQTDELREAMMIVQPFSMTNEDLTELILQPNLPMSWSDRMKLTTESFFPQAYKEWKKILPHHPFTPRDIEDFLSRAKVYCDTEDLTNDQMKNVILQVLTDMFANEIQNQHQEQLYLQLMMQKSDNTHAGQSILQKHDDFFVHFYKKIKKQHGVNFIDFNQKTIQQTVKKIWLELKKQNGKSLFVLEQENNFSTYKKLLNLVLNVYYKENQISSEIINIQASSSDLNEIKEKIQYAKKNNLMVIIEDLNTLPNSFIESLFNQTIDQPSQGNFKIFALNNSTHSQTHEFSNIIKSRMTRFTTQKNDLSLSLSNLKLSQDMKIWLQYQYHNLQERLKEGGSSMTLSTEKFTQFAHALSNDFILNQPNNEHAGNEEEEAEWYELYKKHFPLEEKLAISETSHKSIREKKILLKEHYNVIPF